MRAIALVALACAAAAADGGNSIARYGNTLIVTAPESESLDPHLTAVLRSRISIDAVDLPLSDVGDFLHRATGANVVIAPELRLESNPITLQAKDMSVANVVSWVSRLANCACVPMHGALYFTRDASAPRATKIYDISGLTMDVRDFPGPDLAMSQTGDKQGAGFTLFQATKDDHGGSADERADEVVDMIKKHVAPGTWGE